MYQKGSVFMEKLKAAVVGAGIFGSFHCRAFYEMPDVDLIAICDLNKARAEKLAAEFGIPQVYTDHREMLAKSGADFVTIATPDHLHAQVAIDTANAGINFLVEKPFATKREDIYNMRNAIERNNVRAMCDLHNRSSQPYAMAKQIIDSGRFGNVYNMYIRLNDNKSVATDMLSWSASSSIMWFLGSHSLDLLSYLCGSRPKTVYSLSRKGILEKLGVNTVDIYQTSIEFENGVIAQMENGWITPNANPCVNDIKCNLTGDKGMIAIDASNHNLIQFYSDNKVMVPDIIVRNQIHGRVKGFAYESIRSLVDKLAADEPFTVSLEDAARTSLAILAIMESAKTRMPVEIDYGFLA